MARKKQGAAEVTNQNSNLELACEEHAEKLGQAFQAIITKEFGSFLAPPPILTPTGILPLDALLGGGIVSSGPVMITSTPETGYFGL